jgi:hypothetical protein
MNILGFFNYESVVYAIKVLSQRVPGKMEGEGRLLGGMDFLSGFHELVS